MNLPDIVDSHIHLWNPNRLRYSWLDNLPVLSHQFLPTDFITATSGAKVSKFVFVECSCEPSQNFAEVDWVSALAKNEPRLRGIVANLALEQGEIIQTGLERLVANPLVKGVRRNLQSESDLDFCLHPRFVTGIKLLAKFGFTFDICIRHEQLSNATELARCVPEVNFVLDHLGKPDVRGKRHEPWATDFKALAMLPNVTCKLSGLVTEADWQTWQPNDLKFYLDWALECFGAERVMFGGDWPVVTLATDYARWVETVKQHLSLLDLGDQTKVFRTNAERVYRV